MSNACKHTPGPWTNTPGQLTIWANDGDLQVATVADLPWKETPSGRRCSDSKTEEANARLIAAVPDLLDACDPDMLDTIANDLSVILDRQSVEVDALRALAKRQRAAIAKATA